MSYIHDDCDCDDFSRSEWDPNSRELVKLNFPINMENFKGTNSFTLHRDFGREKNECKSRNVRFEFFRQRKGESAENCRAKWETKLKVPEDIDAKVKRIYQQQEQQQQCECLFLWHICSSRICSLYLYFMDTRVNTKKWHSKTCYKNQNVKTSKFDHHWDIWRDFNKLGKELLIFFWE